MITRPVFSLLGIFTLLVGLGGCSSPVASTPQAAPRPFEGMTLKVACPDGRSRGVVERYGRRWAAREGVRLETVTHGPQAGPEGVEGADVWLIEPAALGHWAADDRLSPLPEAYQRDGAGNGAGPTYHWAGLLPLWRERLLRWGDRAYALPVLGEAPLCFYRIDLFADAGHKAAFRTQHQRDLAPPATWQEYADLTEFFAGRAGPSLPPLSNDDDIDREFHTIAASFVVRASDGKGPPGDGDPRARLFSFQCDFATGEPRVASPGFVHALQLMLRLQACRAAADGKAAPEAFAAGRAALCLADASWISRFQKSAAKPAFGVCRVPGSNIVFDHVTSKPERPPGGNYVPYLGAGGCVGVVPRGSASPDAAFALLAEMGSPEIARQVAIEPEWGGGPFRGEQLASMTGWSSYGLDQAQTTGLLQALRQTLVHPDMGNPATRLRLPNESAYRKALLEEVREALAGKKDAAAALLAVEQRWRGLDPATRRRTEYAHSLGLTPP